MIINTTFLKRNAFENVVVFCKMLVIFFTPQCVNNCCAETGVFWNTTWSIKWLLMPWLFTSPSHQQTLCLLFGINGSSIGSDNGLAPSPCLQRDTIWTSSTFWFVRNEKKCKNVLMFLKIINKGKGRSSQQLIPEKWRMAHWQPYGHPGYMRVL